MPGVILKKIPVMGDGNCGFNAVALGLLHYFVGLPLAERRVAVDAMWQRCLAAKVYAVLHARGSNFFFTHCYRILNNEKDNQQYQDIMADWLRYITIPVLENKIVALVEEFLPEEDNNTVFYFPTPFGGLCKYTDRTLWEYQPKKDGYEFVSGHYTAEGFRNDENPLRMDVTSYETTLLKLSAELFQYYVDLHNGKEFGMPELSPALPTSQLTRLHHDYLNAYFGTMGRTLHNLKKDHYWATAKTITVCCELLGFTAEFRSAPEEFIGSLDPRAIKLLNRGGLHGCEGLHFDLMVYAPMPVRKQKNMTELQVVVSKRWSQCLREGWGELKNRLLSHGFAIKLSARETTMLCHEGQQDQIELILNRRWPYIRQFSKTGQSLVNSDSAARLLTTIAVCQKVVAAETVVDEGSTIGSRVSKRRTVP